MTNTNIKLFENPNFRVAIVGGGKSGNAAIRMLRHNGIKNITVFDDKTGCPLNEFADNFDLVVLSPGIHPNKITAKNITSEIELGLESAHSKIIAITGTDGKSTTTTFCAQILRANGASAIECGNFGYPLCDAILDSSPDTIFVLELSSYQLDLLPNKKYFDAAALMNIAPDHLDRYKTIENYAASKWRIQNMLRDNGVFFGPDSVAPIGSKMPGLHNAKNLGYAVALARTIIPDLKLDFSTLTGLPHRMEVVPTSDGICWVNDSKGTTIQAVRCALNSFDKNVILMLGGSDKDLDFSELLNDIAEKCRAVIPFGAARDKISVQLKLDGERPINLETAVEIAKKIVQTGDTVLLSPGCTSWDEFSSFEERGNKFKELVKTILRS